MESTNKIIPRKFELEDLREELNLFKTRLHQLAIDLKLIKEQDCMLYSFEETESSYCLRNNLSTYSTLCAPKNKNDIGNYQYKVIKKLIELNFNI